MIRQLVAILAVALFMTGCVNPTVSTIQDTKVSPTYSSPAAPERKEQPVKDPNAYRSTDPGRTYSLTLKNADINDVLILLSKESKVPIVAQRGLKGAVNIEAQNKKLGELLFAILKPLGYSATVENGIIMVGRPQLSTRTFRVNYIMDKRNSTSNMNVSGFSGSGSSGSSGSVSITSEGKSDFWGALETSLEMLVFGTSGGGKRDGGGYSRGDDLTKIIAEQKNSSSKQVSARGQEQNQEKLTGEINARLSQNRVGMLDKSTNFQSSSQLVEHEDPQALAMQLADNKLKQLLVNELAGVIQVTDYPENLDKIAAFLTNVEEGTKRQVLIQAHIMEVTLRDKFSLGVNWNTVFSKGASYALTQGIPVTAAIDEVANIFKIKVKDKDFGVVLEALKDQGNINMLSSPKISALNNQKAVIKLTTKQVSWTQTKSTGPSPTYDINYTYQPQVDEVGIFLDVTPQIADSGKITMQIHPSVSEVLDTSYADPTDKSKGSKPIINTREIDTMVEATSGETIVIAGLISDKLNETKQSIPLLGDIPYLGALFSQNASSRIKSELVIMLTPYVLNTKNIEEIRLDHEKRMREMGGNFHLINNLGSMVTEQSSRDWIKRTNRTLPPQQDEPEIKKQPAPQTPAVVNKPQASQSGSPAAPGQATHVPLPEKQTVQPVTAPAAQKPNVTAAVLNVKEKARLKVARTSPTLETIQPSRTGIRLDISKLKERPIVLREYKAKKILVKLPGVQSAMGDTTVAINQFGFGTARIARHADGIWAVFQAKGDELPNVVAEHDKSGLTLRVVPTTAAAVTPPPKAAI